MRFAGLNLLPKLSKSSRTHTVTLLFGILVFTVFGLPDILNWLELRQNFTPFSIEYFISAQTYDETQLYVPGSRKFFSNGSLHREVDVVELSEVPSGYPTTHSVVIGTIGILVNSLETAWVLSHALFPLVVWIIIFTMARYLGIPQIPSIFLATATCFVPFGPRNYMLIGEHSLIQPLELSRTPHPSLSFIFFSLAALALSHAIRRKTFLWNVLAGTALAINFYSYYFYWVAITLGLVTWTIILAAKKRSPELKQLLVISFFMVLFALPYITTVLEATISQSQQALMERVGYFHRTPLLFGLALSFITLVLLVYVDSKRCKYTNDNPLLLTTVLLVFLLGSTLGINFHILTGYDAQHGHFLNRAIQPISFFLVGAFLISGLGKLKRFQNIFNNYTYILFTFCFIILAAYRQTTVAENRVPYHDKRLPHVAVALSAKEFIDTQSVIASSEDRILTLIPALTHAWSFVPLGDRTLSSKKEILTRYLTIKKLEGSDWQGAAEALSKVRTTPNDAGSTGYVLLMEPKIGSETLNKAEEIWESLKIDQILSERRLDFIIAKNEKESILSTNLGRQVIAEYCNNTWCLYRIQQ